MRAISRYEIGIYDLQWLPIVKVRNGNKWMIVLASSLDTLEWVSYSRSLGWSTKKSIIAIAGQTLQ